MLSKYLGLVLALFSCIALVAQPPMSKQEFEKEYQRRIKLEYINEVYIPIDLADAFVQLNKLIDDSSRASFKSMSEEEAASKLFFGFGRWMIVNWGFYEGSRLSHYIKELGITFPDDMAQFIMVSYHRNLNRKPLDVKAQIEYYQEKRRKEHEERLSKGTIIKTETRDKTKGQ
ncbi:MAG: DUF6794 domain-containing protein [Saprospiraceae bacterium]|nr:DUF6794 domain-containing protein [Saprospiraceae bacterium]